MEDVEEAANEERECSRGEETEEDQSSTHCHRHLGRLLTRSRRDCVEEESRQSDQAPHGGGDQECQAGPHQEGYEGRQAEVEALVLETVCV